MDLIRRLRALFRPPDMPAPAENRASQDSTETDEPIPAKTVAERRQEIETFVRNIVARIEGAAALGITTPEAIAAHFNETGLTTRKGRSWTGETVAKFLSSPGAKRYRTKGARV